MADEPQIIELDPEGAPRMSAVILLVCGLLGVGFLLVNVVFTGDDPFHNGWWPDSEDDVPIQQQYNITPNVWRGAGSRDEEEDVEERVAERKQEKKAGKGTTTRPFGLPNPLSRPGVPTPGTPTAPGKTTPGAPGTTGTPRVGTAPPK